MTEEEWMNPLMSNPEDAPQEKHDGDMAMASARHAADGVVTPVNRGMATPQVTPEDAALLKEADATLLPNEFGAYPYDSLITDLAAALRAALAREAEITQKLDTRERQCSDSMYLAMVEADRYVLRQRLEAAERERDTLAAQGKPRTP